MPARPIEPSSRRRCIPESRPAGHFDEMFLHRNANFAAHSARTIAVDQFQERLFLLASGRQLPVQLLQGLVDQGHAGFEIDGLDGEASDPGIDERPTECPAEEY